MDYVASSYESWMVMLTIDHRHKVPLENAYRDFHSLLRVTGWQVPLFVYRPLQAAVALCIAALILQGRRRGWSQTLLLRRAFDLGCCWMMLFGPATENCTYVLLAPTLVLAVWDSSVRRTAQREQPHFYRGFDWFGTLAWMALAVLTFTAIGATTPWGKIISVVGMPLGGLLLFIERMLDCARPFKHTHPLAAPESLAQAA
jgi:hypothetical protein